MPGIDPLHSFESIKLLADARRLEILRLLMAGPATLTQLGRRVGRSPAWVRHHVAALEEAGLVLRDEVRVVGRATEKYYRSASGALLLEQLVLPKTRLPVVLFSGSHDPALQRAAERLGPKHMFLTLYVGSLNGLTNLRQGICHVSGIHLQDENGEYNRSYVQHFFPDREVRLVTLAYRTQGLMLAPGNPKSIRSVQDLARAGLRLANRNAGSGTRLWLDREFEKLDVHPASLRGYAHPVATHTQAAWMVKTGKADAALGLEASARECGLDFVPLFDERYDLVVPEASQKLLSPFLDYVQTLDFRTTVNAMPGYNTAHSGESISM